MNSEKDTLPNNQTILDALNELRAEMNARFEQLDKSNEEFHLKLTNIGIQQDRIMADLGKVISIVLNNRADAKELTAKLYSQSTSVRDL